MPLPMEIVSHPGCISKPCQWNFAISRYGTCPWSTATALQVPCGRTKNRCVMVYMDIYIYMDIYGMLWAMGNFFTESFFGPLPSAKPEGFTLAPNQRILAE